MSQSPSYPSDSLLAREIAQQPQLWQTTLDRVRPNPSFRIPAGLPVLVTGAGTSAYAGSAIAEAWPQAKCIPTTDLLLLSVEEIESALPAIRQGGLAVSLARSGDSPESSAVVLKLQKSFPALQHLAIVCNPNGRVAHLPGVLPIFLDPRTNDKSLAMTASFTNLTLAGLALQHHRVLESDLPGICQRVEQSLPALNQTLQSVADKTSDRVVVLASAMQALTKEIALKIIELTDGRVMALPETFLGFRHGAVGFAREDTPVLCFLSSDPQKQRYEIDLMEDLRNRRAGRLVVIGGNSKLAHENEWFVPAIAPSMPDYLRTPFEMPLAQLLAYHCSIAAGVDPDNPSPRGTITRVVRPFRIHEELTAI